jgi:glycosyltransferase involved in cell wall biosynthesis
MTASISGTLPEPAVILDNEPAPLMQARPIKVLLFYPDYGQNGGIERSILHVARNLKLRNGFEPVVVCSRDGTLHRALTAEGLQVYGLSTAPWFMSSLRRTFDLTTWDQLQHIVEREKPDIAHVHAGLLENLWFRRWGVPIVYHFHGYGTLYSQQQPTDENVSGLKRSLKSWGKRLIRWMFRQTASRLSALLFVSEAEKQRMLQEGYLPETAQGRINVLHNGVPLAEIRQQAMEAHSNVASLKLVLGLPGKARVLTYINRLDENKNPRHFVALARHLLDQAGFEDLHFLLVGDGPLAETLKAETADLPQLHCLGHRDDAIALLGITDLLIYPSRREGFGLGLVEALAAAVPCLAYASEGATEILSGMYNGADLADCRVPVDDFLALAQAAKRVLHQSPEERGALVAAGMFRARDFDAERFIAKLQGVYRSLCPLVSVLLPVYQGEATILGAVKSVLAQSYPHFELIVIDDGSSDSTLERLASIQDARLRVIRQANAGVAVARNTGFAASRGEYIAFIDADDRWLPHKLETEVNTLRQHAASGESPVCLIYSGYEAVDEHNRLIFRPPVRRLSGDLAQAVLEDEGLFLPSTALLHRDIYKAVGGFNPACHHEDRAFFILACQQGFPAYSTTQRLTLYRQSTSGRCRSILTDYDRALSAEDSIVDVLRAKLSATSADYLACLQRRNLLYRFMMYNCAENAQRLHQQAFFERPEMLALLGGKKGWLTKRALASGINFPCQIRIAIQGLTRSLFSPIWAWQPRIRTTLDLKDKF